jgi:hypothetical protein
MVFFVCVLPSFGDECCEMIGGGPIMSSYERTSVPISHSSIVTSTMYTVEL